MSSKHAICSKRFRTPEPRSLIPQPTSHAGQATVSDAAAVVSLAKEEQRAAVAAIRSGQARTLRQAAKANHGRREAASGNVAGLPRLDESQRHSPQRVRRAAKCFEAQCETLLRYIDLAGSACGGPNDYTRRMRDGLEELRGIMRQCANDFGREGRRFYDERC